MGTIDTERLMQGFRMGPWSVLPKRGLIRNGDEERHLEPKVMNVLVALARRQGDVVSNDQIVEDAWDGRPVTDDVIIRCIAAIRKNLDDNARSPEYIENIPRRGYRLKVAITCDEEPEEETGESADSQPIENPRPAYYLPLLAGFVAVVIIAAIVILDRPGSLQDSDGLNSLAVFPLECADADTILCYGVTEELIDRLLQAKGIDNLKVVRSRNPYPVDSSAESVAADLAVDGIFIGKLAHDGDNVWINARIESRLDGSVFWSRTIDGNIDDMPGIRAMLADDVVESLIGESAKLLEADSRPGTFEALDAYMTGQYEFSIRSALSIRKSIAMFEKTIELDEDFGPAYVWLAYAYALLPEYTPESSTLMYEKALLIADKGVAIDPRVTGPAQTVYGFIYHKRGQWTRATMAHLQAINAATVYPISHQLHSRLLASVGRLDASLEAARQAREIDPQQAVLISRLAIAYFWLDELDLAEKYFKRSDAHMEYEAAIHDLAYALFFIRKGDYDRAANEAIAGLEKYGLDTSWVRPVFEGIHNPDKYDDAYRRVLQLSENGSVSANIEVTLWALLGDGDRAMAVARKLEDSGEIFEAELMFIPQLSVLREHPEFPALLDSIGLTEYWASIGCEWQGGQVVCEIE